MECIECFYYVAGGVITVMTKKELLKRCKEENVDLGSKPECTINYFVSKSLLSRPTRHGLGRGKGVRVYFADTAFGEIQEVVRLHNEGMTYEEIKHRKMIAADWIRVMNQLKKTSKTEQEAVELIQNLPYLSKSEKGRLKLVCDLADHLSCVVTNEVSGFFGSNFDDSCHDDIREAARDTLQGFIETELLYDVALPDNDYSEYLDGEKPHWIPLTKTERDIIKSIISATRSNSEMNKCKPADL